MSLDGLWSSLKLREMESFLGDFLKTKPKSWLCIVFRVSSIECGVGGRETMGREKSFGGQKTLSIFMESKN